MPRIAAITAASLPSRSSARANSRSESPRAKSAPLTRPPQPVESAAPAPPEDSVDREASAPTKKLRRSRVPANLAQVYGENAAKRDLEAPAPAEEKKARRGAQERALRKSVIRGDEALRERLAASAGGPLVLGEEEAKRRGRTWQASCGKCGARSTFRTPGAVCACGAICLRDAV